MDWGVWRHTDGLKTRQSNW